MLRLLILCMIGSFELIFAAEIPDESFKNAGKYLYKIASKQLKDYGQPKIMSAILARDYNISQEQIELMRHGLHDYNDPEIRAIIVANDYQISQKKIDVIKNAVKSAIIYYDVHDNFVMVARGDNKLVNAHTKVQHCTMRKRFGSRIMIPCDVNKMLALSEKNFDEEDDDQDDGIL